MTCGQAHYSKGTLNISVTEGGQCSHDLCRCASGAAPGIPEAGAVASASSPTRVDQVGQPEAAELTW